MELHLLLMLPDIPPDDSSLMAGFGPANLLGHLLEPASNPRGCVVLVVLSSQELHLIFAGVLR
jgi:hypothetical protein